MKTYMVGLVVLTFLAGAPGLARAVEQSEGSIGRTVRDAAAVVVKRVSASGPTVGDSRTAAGESEKGARQSAEGGR